MGTGVGEAMLLGAAMGGGSAAITGGDPLKGALLGGLTGGVGSGIGGALGGAAGTEAALATAGTEAATNTAMANALPVSNMVANPVAATGFTPIPAGQSFAQASQAANATSGVNAAMNQALPLTGNAGITSILPQGTSPLIPTAPSVAPPVAPPTFGEGMAKFASDPMASLKANPFTAASAGLAGAMGGRADPYSPEEYNGPLKRFRLSSDYRGVTPYAEGGITDLAAGGYDRMVGEMPMYPQAMARGGISDLGSYSDYARGGRMLKGPGDGMSDSIPASIGGKRPARLATEEFVVPADVVSHLGNGSSDAGAKQLYAMMDRVRTARTGRKSQGREISPQKYMAA
jgi:hypothetical protein